MYIDPILSFIPLYSPFTPVAPHSKKIKGGN